MLTSALAVLLATAPAATSLQALVEQDWDAQMRRNPVWASLLGDRRAAAEWDDPSPEGWARGAAQDRALLDALAQVDRAALPAEDQLTYDLLVLARREPVEAFEKGAHFLAMSYQQGLPEGLYAPPGVHALEELGPSLDFRDTADYEAWIARLRTVPVYVERTTALLRAGQKAGRSQPQVVVDRVLKVLDSQLAAPAAESGFLEPFTRIPEAVPAADRPRLRASAEAAVRDAVWPALTTFRTFMAETYRAAAPAAGGLGQQGGADLYAFLARVHTTTALTPRAIHELGLREVARIRAEMEVVKAQTTFQGDLPAFFTHLRTDPRFFYTDRSALLDAYRALAKRVDPTLVKVFGRLPRLPYGVEPTPEATAPHATTGFYFPAAPDGTRPGTYLVNTYRPETRPRWEMVPLTLHEAVPGHHLQVALAAELTDLPAFHRLGYYNAYGEGWGLYAEWLGHELGLYADPYDHFGQLTWEMWRAVRLVIDTGLHAEGWTREQAIRYFLENSPRPELDVVNEVDRYLAMPGQALGYKLGQIRILELRRRAEKALGPRFDVRAFHDAVLGSGSLPLDVLETRMDAWIAARAASK